jgi:hypothetical protein
LRCYAVALGAGTAQTWVALTDGGKGQQRVLQQGVSGAVTFLLDWWHLSEKHCNKEGLVYEPNAGAPTAWAEGRQTIL